MLAFTDADLPFRLTALRQGYEWIRRGQCEVVFGARDIEGSENLAPRRLWRRLATFAFREVVRRLVSREVTDTQCGLKLFSRRAALEIFGRATIDGFAFDAEVVMLTHRLGLPFRRVPVTLVNEFSSTLVVAAQRPADVAGRGAASAARSGWPRRAGAAVRLHGGGRRVGGRTQSRGVSSVIAVMHSCVSMS